VISCAETKGDAERLNRTVRLQWISSNDNNNTLGHREGDRFALCEGQKSIATVDDAGKYDKAG
jgi:hypothetical protein